MAGIDKFVVVISCGDRPAESDSIRRSLRSSMKWLEEMGYEPEQHENGRKLHYCWTNGETRARIMYYDEWEKIRTID